MRLLRLLIVAVSLTACGPETIGGFTLLPGVSDERMQYDPSLQVGADGTLWLTYVEHPLFGQGVLRPASFRDGRWERGPTLEGYTSGGILGSVDGAPIVETGKDSWVELTRFDEGGWETAASVDLRSFSNGDYPGVRTFRLGADGRLLIGFNLSATDGRVVMHTLGSGTVPLGGNLLAPEELSQGLSSAPRVDFSPSGEPIAAYAIDSSNKIRLKRWDGSAWVSAAPDLETGHWQFVLHVDDRGRFWVLMTVNWAGPENELWVFRFDGDAWQEVGGGALANHFVSEIDPEGRLVVARSLLIDGWPGIQVSRLGLDGWEELLELSKPRYSFGGAAIAFEADGTPVLAWTEGDPFELKASYLPNRTRVRVARHTGAP